MPITPNDQDLSLVERLFGQLPLTAADTDAGHRYRLTQAAALLRLSMAGDPKAPAVDDILRHAIDAGHHRTTAGRELSCRAAGGLSGCLDGPFRPSHLCETAPPGQGGRRF